MFFLYLENTLFQFTGAFFFFPLQLLMYAVDLGNLGLIVTEEMICLLKERNKDYMLYLLYKICKL